MDDGQSESVSPDPDEDPVNDAPRESDSESIDRAELERQILALVTDPNYQPVKPRVISKKLGLSRDQQPSIKRAIKRLAKRGKLSYAAKHLVRPSDGRAERGTQRRAVTGVLRMTSRGNAYVRPQSSPPGDRSGDIYVPAKRTSDAADGDVVAVRLKGQRARGDRVLWVGEVVEVLERRTHRFVGVYIERGGFAFVQVDGTAFANPIYVGDPGAKSATPGDKVVIEMVRFPSATNEGEAVIVEVLGPRGEAGVDTLSVIREFDLPEQFSKAVLDDARRQADAFDETEISARADLTSTPVITIDPFDARDFDDAISLEPIDNGHWKLGVHIADVCHFVRAKSELDREARDRGTSVYLPDRVLPMLPEIISNNLASLQPERVRFTKTVVIEFTRKGARVDTAVMNAAIRSDRRFTYQEVDQFLGDRKSWKAKLPAPVFELLSNMHTLAMTLRKRRLDRGAIELTMPEIKIDLNKRGQVAGAHLVEHTESHQIIEEFMLAANEAVADWLHERELNLLRRVHEQPDPRKLKNLSAFVRELGIPCESLESRFEIKRVIEAVAGRPEEHAVNFAVLRSMAKAHYSPLVEGHYALHSNNYCHFTSPIRRYPDLTIHRMIESLLQGNRPPDNYDRQLVLGEHCSQREQRAAAAERELVKLKLLNYLATRVGEAMDAVITGVERYGLFAQGTELPAEGFVHLSTLADDHYEFDPRAHCLSGKRSGNEFRLGDLVRVEIAHVDVDRRQLDFRVVRRSSKSKPKRNRETGRKGAKGKKTKSKGSKDKRSKGAKGRKHR